MELFDTVFWIVLVISAFGGVINTVIRSVNSYEKGTFTRSKAFVWFIRDLLTGIGAGFAAWLANLAMNNTAGMYFAAFIAGLAGVAAINQLLRAGGYKTERDLTVQYLENETDIIEPLKKRLAVAESELNQTKEALRDVQSRLQATEVREKFQEYIEDLEERLATAEKKLGDQEIQDDSLSAQDDMSDDEKQQGQMNHD